MRGGTPSPPPYPSLRLTVPVPLFHVSLFLCLPVSLSLTHSLTQTRTHVRTQRFPLCGTLLQHRCAHAILQHATLCTRVDVIDRWHAYYTQRTLCRRVLSAMVFRIKTTVLRSGLFVWRRFAVADGVCPRIQRVFRRYRAHLGMRRLVTYTRSATVVQAAVRGFLQRRRYHRLLARRHNAALGMQVCAGVCGCVSRGVACLPVARSGHP